MLSSKLKPVRIYMLIKKNTMQDMKTRKFGQKKIQIEQCVLHRRWFEPLLNLNIFGKKILKVVSILDKDSKTTRYPLWLIFGK